MASDFSASWALSRQRFVDSVKDLSAEQLNWKLHSDSLTIGEMAMHVAGVERWFVAQMTAEELSEDAQRLAKCATEGVVNDNPFPFSTTEITPDLVRSALAEAELATKPVIEEPSQEVFSVQIKSALGPIIDGRGALTRLAFHPAYHQGQVYLIRTAPGFPGDSEEPNH